ncbi:MAG: hypothetical protein FWC86_06205 [Coriobacteriia bacterium]|nr:hypothetical protein [Coriobacteriia bacterium]
MGNLKLFKTAKATAGIGESSVGTAAANYSGDGDTTIAQKLGIFFLYATAAWSVMVNIDSFGTFLVMFNEMFITHQKVMAGYYLIDSFILGFGAVPLFVLGVLLRKGAPYGKALTWGSIGLITSILAAIAWLVVIILISVVIGLSPF